jgi:hypothetical protein
MARPFLFAIAFLGAVGFGGPLIGCSGQPLMTQEERQANEERQSIERPARGINEETSIMNHIGQVGVVLLVVGITLAGILIPVLLL